MCKLLLNDTRINPFSISKSNIYTANFNFKMIMVLISSNRFPRKYFKRTIHTIKNRNVSYNREYHLGVLSILKKYYSKYHIEVITYIIKFKLIIDI